MLDRINNNVAFLSTYPPRECGIATFTQDLVRALDKVGNGIKPKIIAISNHNQYQYDRRVAMEIIQDDRESYLSTADKINESEIELLVIEHEYGIFGGESGEYILDFIDRLNIPFVTTLHTILPDPSEKQKEILQQLGEKSAKIVTMARNTKKILEEVYEVEPEKIIVIHHGVPYRTLPGREELKKKHGLYGRNIISTFGLISPGKGLEYGIEAIAKVAKDHPDVLYLILGQTHPCVKKEQGEVYRQNLMNMVRELGIENNVCFVNKYLTKEEIIQYLQMSDIYMTPYLGKNQAVSGTLAYAVGYGRVIISTPYSYAKEMLGNGRGLLAKFRDSDSLAENIKYVLENSDAKEEMERRTQNVGRGMMWENVARQYKVLFKEVVDQGEREERMLV